MIWKSLIILIDLGIKTTHCYKKDFENDFFINTEEYYRQEAQKSIEQMSCSEYLKLVERRIKEEEDRCLNYLIEATKAPLV